MNECDRLQTLLLGGLNITDAAVVHLARRRGATLRRVDMSECTNLTDKAVIALAEFCGGRWLLGLAGRVL